MPEPRLALERWADVNDRYNDRRDASLMVWKGRHDDVTDLYPGFEVKVDRQTFPAYPGREKPHDNGSRPKDMPYHLQQHYRHLAAQRSNARSSAVFKRWLALYAVLALSLLALVLS